MNKGKKGKSPMQLKVVVIQSLSCFQLFAAPWTEAHQASLSFIIYHTLLKVISTESVIPSNHLILCCSLLLLVSIFPSIRVFCNQLSLHIWWSKYWSFSFSISPNEYSGLIYFKINWFSLQYCKVISLQPIKIIEKKIILKKKKKRLSGFLSSLPSDSQVFSNTTIQKHQFFSVQPSL